MARRLLLPFWAISPLSAAVLLSPVVFATEVTRTPDLTAPANTPHIRPIVSDAT